MLQVFEVVRVVLKVSLQSARAHGYTTRRMDEEITYLEFLGCEELLLDLLQPRFADSVPRHGAQCVLHAISERLDLFLVKRVLAYPALLRPFNAPPHVFVVLRTQHAADRLVLAVLRCGEHKGQRGPATSRPCGASYAVRVCARRRRQVEVEHAGHVQKVNAARNAILGVALRSAAFFPRSWFWLRGWGGLSFAFALAGARVVFFFLPLRFPLGRGDYGYSVNTGQGVL